MVSSAIGIHPRVLGGHQWTPPDQQPKSEFPMPGSGVVLVCAIKRKHCSVTSFKLYTYANPYTYILHVALGKHKEICPVAFPNRLGVAYFSSLPLLYCYFLPPTSKAPPCLHVSTSTAPLPLPASHHGPFFTFLVSVVPPGYRPASEDLELGTSDMTEHAVFVFLGLRYLTQCLCE